MSSSECRKESNDFTDVLFAFDNTRGRTISIAWASFSNASLLLFCFLSLVSRSSLSLLQLVGLVFLGGSSVARRWLVGGLVLFGDVGIGCHWSVGGFRGLW